MRGNPLSDQVVESSNTTSAGDSKIRQVEIAEYAHCTCRPLLECLDVSGHALIRHTSSSMTVRGSRKDTLFTERYSLYSTSTGVTW